MKTSNVEWKQLPEFNKLAVQLAYGEGAQVLTDDLVAMTQALSGTGKFHDQGDNVKKQYY
jgi:aspartate/tyrosine/aromatic aminotransferase